MGNLVKTFIMESGERYCLLVDQCNGLPLFYPNLYVTTQVRNKSLSYSSMESALNGISVLLRFMEERGGNIEERFRVGDFLKTYELDALRDFCQIRFKLSSVAAASDNGMFTFFELREHDEKVSSQTEYIRLTVISRYAEWLAKYISNNDRAKKPQILEMKKSLQARRPIRKGRNTELKEKGLDEDQISLVFELFRPESEFNPFKEKSVRIRNRLIFLMLYHLGIRGGELLNIRIRDIDFELNQLVIARRADEIDDPRAKQPLVKTLDRRIAIKETLVNEIHKYVLNVRKKVPNSNKNDYLFITHKSGPTQGLPLSISAYKKVINVVRKASPDLYNLTGHALRHTWNYVFSKRMDNMDNPPSYEVQEKIRSYSMGWREGSGTGAKYNQRAIKEKANEVALGLQEGMIRLPKGINNEQES